MKIEDIALKDIKPYEKNPKTHSKKQIGRIAESIKRYGMVQPLVVDKKNTLVIGHGRYEAMQLLNMETAPCVRAENLTPKQIRELRIVDNKLNEESGWNAFLVDEMEGLDLSGFGLDANLSEDTAVKMPLKEEFKVLPCSVLDRRTPEWQENERFWKKKMRIASEEGRGSFYSFSMTCMTLQEWKRASTSVFSPTLCEILISWFSEKQDNVLDVFAGGVVRGAVCAFLDRRYTGIELRKEQIDANESYVKKMESEKGENIRYISGDAERVLDEVSDCTYDFLYTCPPYGDLEVYSDLPDDLSNMNYDNFLKKYRNIIRKIYRVMKKGSFSVFVVGDIRDKKGNYRGFPASTIEAFIDAGFSLYNDIVTVAPVRLAMLTARKRFYSSRKIGKIHENVLVFKK